MPERPFDLRPLLAPQSIAVVGASPDRSKPGGRCLGYLQDVGYPGRIFPINPRYEEINGLSAYARLEDLPEPADLAVILIPASGVVAAVSAAGDRGVRSVIVCSSGFSEVGPEGQLLEQKLVAAANAGNVVLLGPNCLGYFDARHHVAATFSTALQVDAHGSLGRIAFVSQSGALGAGIFAVGRLQGAGLGMFVSTGNEAAIGITEVVRHLATHDPDVTTLLCYVEGVRDGRAFVASAREARRRGKRVACVKVGRTAAGVRASASHTGALAGTNEVWDAGVRRGGVIVANDMQHLLDVGIALDAWPGEVGSRIGIVSMSGGAAALMADRAAESGLELPEFGPETRERLSEVLPGFSGTANPVDYGAIYGDLAAIEQIVRVVAEADELDIVALFVGLTPAYVGILEPRLVELARQSKRPMVVAWLGAPQSSLSTLRAAGIPAYDDPSRAIDAAAALALASRPLPQDLQPGTSMRERVEQLRGVAGPDVSERAMKGLLTELNLPLAREAFATTVEEAQEIAQRFATHLAVKVDAEGLLHKSDIGGVKLNVTSETIAKAFNDVVCAGRDAGYEVRGALVAEMAKPGVELIVGARWDEQFGPTVLVGAGGVLSEVLDDARVELAPIAADEAEQMLMSLRIGALLRGYRGEAERDVRAAAEAVAAVSRLIAEAGGSLTELDLNPVVVYPKGNGCLILDAAGVLAKR